jgi:tripartite-type tricarboxylate transporter receptor subunit TctC
MVLITNQRSPIKNLDQLKFYVKSNPDKFNVGVFNSNIGKLIAEWARKEGLPAPQIVTYKGSGQMLTDVVGGHIMFGFDTWTSVAPLFKDNRLQVLATMSDSVQKEIKTINPKSESINIVKQYPDLNFTIWWALVAPAGTDRALLSQYATMINRGLRDVKYREKMNNLFVLEFGGSDNDVKEIQQRSMVILNRLK